MNNSKISINLATRKNDGWPTEEQNLLLKAALLQGPEVVEYWNKWRSTVEFEDIDNSSQCLLPLLYENLSEHGIDEPILSKYKGVYRMIWYKNQMVVQHISPILEELQTVGVKIMVLNGAALIEGYNQHQRLRRIGTVDLLVPVDRGPDCVDILFDRGWQPEDGRSRKSFTECHYTWQNAHSFINHAGHKLNLVWHLALDSVYGNSDEDFWRCGRLTEFTGLTFRALCQIDQLLAVCVNAAWGKSEPVIQWIADAAMIMQNSPSQIDWERMLRVSSKHRLVLPLREILIYLVKLLDLAIPQEIIQRLESMEVSKTELWEHQIRKRSNGWTGNLPRYWFNYARLSRKEKASTLQFNFTGFPKYLQTLWTLDHLWQVPVHAGYKGMRRVWKRVLG